MNYYDYWKKSGYIWLTDSKNDDIQTYISKQKTTKEILEEADKTTTVFGNNPSQLIEGFVFVAKGPVPANLRITRAGFQRLSFKAKSRTYDINKNK